MSRGRFITFEGGDGVGKTTQIRHLGARLQAEGWPVLLTREPGGSAGAEQIRSLLVRGDTGRWDALSELLLLAAARRDHLVKTVWPALAAGQWVLCDRFTDSSLAYQGYGHGLSLTAVTAVQELVTEGTAPDCTLILDLSEPEGGRRAVQRGGGEDRYERLDAAFHQRVRQGFLACAEADPERCVVIDAHGSEEAVAARIWRAMLPFLSGGAERVF